MTEPLRRNDRTGIELREDGGKFVVLVDGDEVVRTGVLSSAEAEYAFQVEQRSEVARRTAENERNHYAMQAMRSESFARRAALGAKKGGKGGRGGV